MAMFLGSGGGIDGSASCSSVRSGSNDGSSSSSSIGAGKIVVSARRSWSELRLDGD